MNDKYTCLDCGHGNHYGRLCRESVQTMGTDRQATAGLGGWVLCGCDKQHAENCNLVRLRDGDGPCNCGVGRTILTASVPDPESMVAATMGFGVKVWADGKQIRNIVDVKIEGDILPAKLSELPVINVPGGISVGQMVERSANFQFDVRLDPIAALAASLDGYSILLVRDNELNTVRRYRVVKAERVRGDNGDSLDLTLTPLDA